MCRLWLLLFVVVSNISEAAPGDRDSGTRVLLDRATQMNRNGDWQDAAELCSVVLARKGLTAIDECNALLNAIHANALIGETRLAHTYLERLNQRRMSFADDHWINLEFARVKRLLADKEVSSSANSRRSAPARTAKRNSPKKSRDDFPAHKAPGLVWSARLANSQGEYSEAVRLTDIVRGIPQVVPVVACDALMHAFYAHHQLGDTNARDLALKEFVDSVPKLESDSSLPSEMRDLLTSLDLPVPEALSMAHHPAFVPVPDASWKTVDAAERGIDAVALREHEALARRSGADAILVCYRGQIVSEWYSDRYAEPMATMSSVKSITALLAGLLIADGKIESVDDPVSKYIPQWREGIRGRVRIRHLLNMTSGLPDFRGGRAGVGFAENKNEFVIGLTPTVEPGTRWSYSNEGSQLLSPILEKAAGMPLEEYAQKRLFEPLGMRNTTLKVIDGQALTYADANTTLRDFARLGVMMLNDGKWGDRQVVPAEWVRACISPCPVNKKYGYLWWLETSPRSYSMRGYLNTSVYVFPEHDLVIARMQHKVYLHAMDDYDVDRAAELLFRAVAGKN